MSKIATVSGMIATHVLPLGAFIMSLIFHEPDAGLAALVAYMMIWVAEIVLNKRKLVVAAYILVVILTVYSWLWNMADWMGVF